MNKKNVFWGILIIVIGVIIGLNSLNITNINIFFMGWWTLFFIVPALIGLFNKKNIIGNLVLLSIGIILFLGLNDIIDFSIIYKLITPILIVYFGFAVLFGDKVDKTINKKIESLNKNGGSNYSAIFSSQEISLNDKNLNGLTLDAVFGGLEFNLSNCVIDNDVVINASAVFGGIDIIIPKDVNVIVRSTSIFGGVDNKNRKNINDKPTIYINATCVFGGVDIK